jgi:CRP-like cAMP-binding protein
MSLDSDIQQMRLAPIFQCFDFEALKLLAFSSEARLLRGGDVLFKLGEVSDCGYFMLNGSIALERSGQTTPARTVGPGHLIGERALMADTVRSVTATAREPSKALRISRALFLRVLGEYPDAARAVHTYMAKSLTDYTEGLKRFPPRSLV